jgi:hypothetical protein
VVECSSGIGMAVDRRGGSPRDQGSGILAGFSCAGNTVLPARFPAEVRIPVDGTVSVQPGVEQRPGACVLHARGMSGCPCSGIGSGAMRNVIEEGVEDVLWLSCLNRHYS